jgi:hypothetical protein
MNPQPDKKVIVHEEGKSESLPIEINMSNGECFIFATGANYKYLIESKLKVLRKNDNILINN